MFQTAVARLRQLLGRGHRPEESAAGAASRRLDRNTLSALGLQRQPFEDQSAADELFVDDAIEMQINMLTEHLRNGEMLPLIKGEPGSGKTSLLILLMTRSNDEFHYFVARGMPRLRAEQVIIDMLRLLTRPIPGEPRECFRELARRLRHLVADGRPAVLVIDDADAIPDVQLNNLLAAHDSLRKALGGSFRLLLAAQPAIELRLARLDSQHLRSGRLFATDLRPLARPRVGPYLQQRLKAAGLADAAPLDDAALDRIAQQGSGLPRLVEAAAAAELETVARQH